MNEENLPPEKIVYTNIDADTIALIEVALNCMTTLADAQMLEQSRDDLLTICDELGFRFGIAAIELEDTGEQDADGEKIYKPLGGVFNDEDIDDCDDLPTASDTIN
jgi:hypothetical protein|tara:strand:+ start:1368 stop:1685 length:318 start_codon:yes stop_codon:yes gene_type:complete